MFKIANVNKVKQIKVQKCQTISSWSVLGQSQTFTGVRG